MINLPNLISIARLISVPVTVWLITEGELGAAFWLFLLAGLSDAVDGFIAKTFNQTTKLGRILDPVADKAMLVSVYVALGFVGSLPSWIVILVVSRDILIIGAFSISRLLGQKIAVHPLRISKMNTGVQIVLAAVVLAGGSFVFAPPLDGLMPHWAALTEALIYLTALTTVLSGGAYLVRWLRELGDAEDGE